jgi:hypothetical protein
MDQDFSKQEGLRNRTKKFALRIIKLFRHLPRHDVCIDETVFWLECLIESGILKPGPLTDILKEANELVAIFAASQRTARS